MELEERYRTWIDEQIEVAINRQFSGNQIQVRLTALRKAILSRHPALYSLARNGNQSCPALDDHALRLFRQEVRDGMQLPTLAEYTAKPQEQLF